MPTVTVGQENSAGIEIYYEIIAPASRAISPADPDPAPSPLA